MSESDDESDVLRAMVFLAGLALLPAVWTTPEWMIDSWIEGIWLTLHDFGVVGAKGGPGPTRRAMWHVVGRVLIFAVAGVCVLYNLEVFRNRRGRDDEADDG